MRTSVSRLRGVCAAVVAFCRVVVRSGSSTKRVRFTKRAGIIFAGPYESVLFYMSLPHASPLDFTIAKFVASRGLLREKRDVNPRQRRTSR